MEVQLTRKGFLDFVKFKSISKSKLYVDSSTGNFCLFFDRKYLIARLSKILTSQSRKENFFNSFNKED